MPKLPTLNELQGTEETDETEEEKETVTAMDRKFYLLALDDDTDEWEKIEGPTSYGKCLTAARDYFEQPWAITVELESAKDGVGLVALQPKGFLPIEAMDDLLDGEEDGEESAHES
jgi:hypothetical protein